MDTLLLLPWFLAHLNIVGYDSCRVQYLHDNTASQYVLYYPASLRLPDMTNTGYITFVRGCFAVLPVEINPDYLTFRIMDYGRHSR